MKKLPRSFWWFVAGSLLMFLTSIHFAVLEHGVGLLDLMIPGRKPVPASAYLEAASILVSAIVTIVLIGIIIYYSDIGGNKPK